MERLKRKLVFAEGGHASQLLRIMQDIAGDDADRRGGGMDALAAKNCAWVLVKPVSYTHLTLPTICSV